jgi:diguanylate cyclase (GGDEF)-like protein
MHDSIGVLQTDPSGRLVGCNNVLEELAAPWGTVDVWWEEVRRQLEEVAHSECDTCRQTEYTGALEVRLKTPGEERVDFRLTFHGHTHGGSAESTPTSRVTSMATVERGAVEFMDGEHTDGLTQLSEATAPGNFEALGLSSISAHEGLSEESSPGEIALAYVRRALSWPLRSALRQLEPLVRDLNESGRGEANHQILKIHRATKSLLDLVQNVDSREPDHKQRQFLDALRSLAAGMSQSLDIDHVADQIFECFDNLLGFKRGAIVVRRDGETEILADRGGGQVLKDEIVPVDWLRGVHQSAPELVVTDPAFRETAVSDLDATANALLGEDEMPKTTDTIDAWIALPLVGRDGETFGCLGLQREHPGDQRLTIESYDRQLISALADQAALAILNAWKYEEARREANTDPVTELYGRRYMERRTQEAMLQAANTGEDLSLLMVDIDHFKEVNDKYGHVVGDAILEKVATRCRNVLRDRDLVGRYGGEEFVCLLPGAGLSAAREAGERLRRSVRTTQFAVNGHEVQITVTVGVSEFTEEIDDFADFVDRADAALYSAKRAGRDRVATYNDDLSNSGSNPVRPS